VNIHADKRSYMESRFTGVSFGCKNLGSGRYMMKGQKVLLKC